MENNLFSTLKSDSIKYRKENKEFSDILKIVISEVQRDPNKNYSDEKVFSVIRKMIKDLKTMNKYGKNSNKEIKFLETYLPKQFSKKRIKEEINKIDMTKLKNKFAVIGILKKKFGDSINPELVKEILNE